MPATAHTRLLLIDDDPLVRDLGRHLGQVFGWAVETSSSPGLDPARVARFAPDVLVLDYWFGREPLSVPFLERLRADPATAELPVLLITATWIRLDHDRAQVDRLVDGVLAKPFGVAEFRAAVEACRRRRPAVVSRFADG